MKKWIVPTVVFIVYGLFILLRLNSIGAEAFITAGDQFCNTSIVRVHGAGYDGQFFYRLSLDPFTSNVNDHGIKLDNPSYRHQRILYPLLTWVFSFGNSGLVPYMMIFLNLVGLTVMSYYLARKLGYWAFGVMIYPGFVLTLLRDLSEIIAVMFVVIGLYYMKDRKWLSALMLSIAVMTKETTLLVSICALGYHLFFKKDWKWFLMPVGVFILMQFVMFLNWGSVPVLMGGGNIGMPFAAVFGLVVNQFALIELLGIGYLLAVGLYSVFSYRKESVTRMGFVLYSVLGICLTSFVWVQDWSAYRALTEWFVLGMILVIGSKSAHRVPLILLFGFVWIEMMRGRF